MATDSPKDIIDWSWGHPLPSCSASCLALLHRDLLEDSHHCHRFLVLQPPQQIQQLGETAWFPSQIEKAHSSVPDTDGAQFNSSPGETKGQALLSNFTDIHSFNCDTTPHGHQNNDIIYPLHPLSAGFDCGDTMTECIHLLFNDHADFSNYTGLPPISGPTGFQGESQQSFVEDAYSTTDEWRENIYYSHAITGASVAFYGALGSRDQVPGKHMIYGDGSEVATSNFHDPSVDLSGYWRNAGLSEMDITTPLPDFLPYHDAQQEPEDVCAITFPDDQQSLLNQRANPQFEQRPQQNNMYSDLHFSINAEMLRSMMSAGSGVDTSLSKWKLDRYILFLSSMLKPFFQCYESSKDVIGSIVTEGTLWVVREAWPEVEGYWKMTASFYGFCQYELWRNFPCHATYDMLHPAYRPTPTQLRVLHSPVIDWLPWPDLRDLVIRFQDEIDVDIVCKTAIENVVSHRLAVTGRAEKTSHKHNTWSQQPGISSFKTWDICCLEGQSGDFLKRSAKSLIYKPRSAPVVALERAYGLVYDDFATQKLHRAFFEKYPFLYCESAASSFRIQDLPTVPKKDISCPQHLNSGAMRRLRELVKKKLQCPRKDPEF